MQEKRLFKISESQVSCQGIVEVLGAYLDGELNAQDREIVEFHLRNCLSCSDEVRRLEKSDRALRSHEVEAPPQRIWQRIEAQLKSKGLLRRDGHAPLRGQRRFAAFLSGIIQKLIGHFREK